MIEHETTVADEGVALFTDEWQEKPRLEALLRSYLNRLQELEDTTWAVLESRLIDNAVDSQLDVLGKLVGQRRMGLDDDTYRLFIKARALVNRSKGRGPDIIGLCTLLFGEFNTLLVEMYPASFVIETAAASPLTPALAGQVRQIARLIAAARAAGVGSSIHYTEEDEAGLFEFSNSGTQVADTPHGFSGVVAPTVGGTFIGAV